MLIEGIERRRIGRLRRVARNGKDENARLQAARDLKDPAVLKQLALDAKLASVRREAARLIEHQSFLTAIALSAWDIEQGRRVVARITNLMLLLRVARSARQDAVRVAAAKKLRARHLLKQIAASTADLSLRWEVAGWLNDPMLMADVALFKLSNPRLEAVRRKAHLALMTHLDRLSQHNRSGELLAFMYDQAYLPFKLQAFLRLSADDVSLTTLRHIARHEFQFVAPAIIASLLRKLKASGWEVHQRIRCFVCPHCHGRGGIMIKTVSSGRYPDDNGMLTCPECNGRGCCDALETICSNGLNQSATLKLPLPE